MTDEEKRAIIEKNLEADPALKAEYEALAGLLSSPEEAERKLAADPALRERYNAVVAKVTRGMELSEDDLDNVTGGAVLIELPVQAFFDIWRGGAARPAYQAPKASDLVYRSGASGPNTAGQITLL